MQHKDLYIPAYWCSQHFDLSCLSIFYLLINNISMKLWCYSRVQCCESTEKTPRQKHVMSNFISMTLTVWNSNSHTVLCKKFWVIPHFSVLSQTLLSFSSSSTGPLNIFQTLSKDAGIFSPACPQLSVKHGGGSMMVWNCIVSSCV